MDLSQSAPTTIRPQECHSVTLASVWGINFAAALGKMLLLFSVYFRNCKMDNYVLVVEKA